MSKGRYLIFFLFMLVPFSASGLGAAEIARRPATVEVLSPYLPDSSIKQQVPGIEVQSYRKVPEARRRQLEGNAPTTNELRDMSFIRAELEAETRDWDELDKDMLFMRAGRYEEDQLAEIYPNITREKMIKLKKVVLEGNKQ